MLSAILTSLLLFHFVSSIILFIVIILGTIIFLIYERDLERAGTILQKSKAYLGTYIYLMISLFGWLLFFIFCEMTY